MLALKWKRISLLVWLVGMLEAGHRVVFLPHPDTVDGGKRGRVGIYVGS